MTFKSHIMTCDLEDWYHPSLVGAPIEKWGSYESRVEVSIDHILRIFKETNTQATFFVLGYVAERSPQVIEKIALMGHEIACHSYSHRLIYNLSRDEFMSDTEKAISAIEKILGHSPRGYRAPSWSVSVQLDWFWKSLDQFGFEYDSSLYPYKTFLYGDNKNPRTPFKFQKYNLYEIPPSVGEVLGKRIPFSGGFFLRVLPISGIRYFINQYEKSNFPAILYFHPWEIDPEIPRQNLGFKNNFITYVNIGQLQKKIRKLTQMHRFVSIENFLRDYRDGE